MAGIFFRDSFVKLGDSFSVFKLAMSDISLLLENPRSGNLEVIKQQVIDKIKGLVPVLGGFIRDASSYLTERSRLVEKINGALSSEETRVILKPLLLSFIDRFLIIFHSRNTGDQPSENSEVKKARWTSFLEVQLDGFIEAI